MNEKKQHGQEADLHVHEYHTHEHPHGAGAMCGGHAHSGDASSRPHGHTHEADGGNVPHSHGADGVNGLSPNGVACESSPTAFSCAGAEPAGPVLTIRMHSGLSGDMFLAGLLCMTELSGAALNEKLAAIMPDLSGGVRLVRGDVNGIGGWRAEVALPHEHAHRTFADIAGLIAGNGMSDEGKRLATQTFALLARAEAAVHGKTPEEVCFHEVGALDSILDISLACELFAMLKPSRLTASPLPLADGSVHCAHGVIPLPAPAVLELLQGVPVRPFPGQGETVTPTAIALLRSLGATFGPWPAIRVEKSALVYGTRVFENVPNGAVFVLGTEARA